MFNDFLENFNANGAFKPGTAKLFNYYIGTFGRWLEQQGITDHTNITEEMVGQFLEATDWAPNTRQIFTRFYLKELVNYYTEGPKVPKQEERKSEKEPEGDGGGGNGESEDGDLAGAEIPPVTTKPTMPDIKKKSHKGTLRKMPTKQDVLKQLPARDYFHIYGVGDDEKAVSIRKYSLRDVMPWGGVEEFIHGALEPRHNYSAYHVFYIDEGGNEIPQTTIKARTTKGEGGREDYVAKVGMESLEEMRKQQREDARERAKKMDELMGKFINAWSEGKPMGGGSGSGGDMFTKAMEMQLVQEFMGMRNRDSSAIDVAIEELKRMRAEEKERQQTGQKPQSPMDKFIEMKTSLAMIEEMFPPRRRRDDEDDNFSMPALPPPPVEPKRNSLDEAKELVQLVLSMMPKPAPAPTTDPAVLAQIETMKVHLEYAQKQNEALIDQIKALANNDKNQQQSSFSALAQDLRSAKELMAEFNQGASGGGEGRGETTFVDFLDNLVDRLPEIVHEVGRVAALSDDKKEKKTDKKEAGGGDKKKKKSTGGSADARKFVKLIEGAKNDEELLQYLMLMFHRISEDPEQAKVAREVLAARGKKLRLYVNKILERLPFEDGIPQKLPGRITALIHAHRQELLSNLSAS